jgi:hypothetical protein
VNIDQITDTEEFGHRSTNIKQAWRNQPLKADTVSAKLLIAMLQ